METFGHYHLEQVLGRGVMGEVFRAVDTRHDRTVALKRLRAELTDEAGYQERFRRESQLAARLTSPHVIPIHDFGEIDGRLYLDMRLVAGPDLGEILDRDGPLAPTRAVEVVRQVADALDDAHAHDLAHRDVKPSNVLVTVHRDRHFAYLADFGIVRAAPDTSTAGLTATGTAPGTPAYMAPELFAGDPPDDGRATDVYALGCLLVALLTGHPPFRRSGPGLMYDHLHTEPPTPSTEVEGVPAALDAVVARALAKAPAERFAGAGDLADAATTALRDRPAPAHVPAGTGAPGSQRTTTVTASPFASPAGPPRTTPAPTPRWDSGPSAFSGGPPSWPGATWPGGPSWNAGPPTGPPPPPKRRRGLVVALVAGVLAVVVAAAVTVVVVLRGTDDPPPVVAPPPVTTTTPPVTTTTTAPVSGVVAVFPDIASYGSSCQIFIPAGTDFTTGSGQRATTVYRCAYDAVVPGAAVYYTQWPSAAAAREWYDNSLNSGDALDNTDQWQFGDARQGPLRYWQAPSAVVGTGGYDDRVYTYDIETDTLPQATAVFDAMNLRPIGEVGG